MVSVAQLLAGIAATIVAIVVHGGDGNTGAIVAYGAQVTAFLIVYSLPIVALMSLVSAAMASVGLALLVGLGGYAILALALAWMPLDGMHGDDRQLPGAERAQAVPAAARARAGAGRERGRAGLRGAVRVPGLAGLPDAGRVMSATPIIKTEGPGPRLRRARARSTSIDLALEAGAPIGLVGPNGAGKTTFFSVLCGFLRPTRGTVEVLGRPPLAPRRARPGGDPSPGRGVREAACRCRASSRCWPSCRASRRRRRARRPRACCSWCCWRDAARKTPETLSHGMLKRIAIAQAFLGAPELVLLDEPTAGLDPATASEMKNLIRSLDKERTFIISSHNLQDIEELCGSVVILDRGKIVEHRKVSELVARTSCLTFRLEADPPEAIVAKLSAVALVTRVELGRPGERRLAVHFRDEGEGAATRRRSRCCRR